MTTKYVHSSPLETRDLLLWAQVSVSDRQATMIHASGGAVGLN
jgi:hypothetical protein